MEEPFAVLPELNRPHASGWPVGRRRTGNDDGGRAAGVVARVRDFRDVHIIYFRIVPSLLTNLR